jgi:hypothetical protein
MTFLTRLFGSRAPALATPAVSQLTGSRQSPAQEGSKSGTRRELLRVALRETLHRHGIPASWVAADVLVSTSRDGERGIHCRLVLKHWEPRLLAHAVPFQHSLVKRVTTLDASAANWLTGMSWQLALDDESICPAMPPPRFWTVRPELEPLPAAPEPEGGSGDVIGGPPQNDAQASDSAEDPVRSPKVDLAQIFAARDADFKRRAGRDLDPQPTQPMFLGTEPAKL